ncbi:MAG: hypothetical protein LBC91_00530, partial [Candidatus Accumulibacter sp.]|nr:hypothetical protein [Accumulibacter sp.]
MIGRLAVVGTRKHEIILKPASTRAFLHFRQESLEGTLRRGGIDVQTDPDRKKRAIALFWQRPARAGSRFTDPGVHYPVPNKGTGWGSAHSSGSRDACRGRFSTSGTASGIG